MAGLIGRCIDAYYAPQNWEHRRDRSAHWLMSREWYDRIRAEGCTEEQEHQRAASHARAMIDPFTGAPWRCPVCAAEPFGDVGELAAHVRRFADPDYREPDPADRLLDLPVIVRPDAGEPRIVAGP